jgi:hypothetical protein
MQSLQKYISIKFRTIPTRDILESSHEEEEDEGSVVVSAKDIIVEPEQVLNSKKRDISVHSEFRNNYSYWLPGRLKTIYKDFTIPLSNQLDIPPPLTKEKKKDTRTNRKKKTTTEINKKKKSNTTRKRLFTTNEYTLYYNWFVIL